MTQPTSIPPDSRLLPAIALLMLGILALGFQDVVMKNLSDRYSVFQMLFIRGLFGLAIFQLGLFCLRWGNPLSVDKIGVQLLRGTLLFGALACYYTALSAMPLLEVVAIFFTAPILATVLSSIILKERAGLGRSIAVVVGFAGVLVMIRPQGQGVNSSAALIAVAAALLYASSIVATRYLGETQKGVTTAYYTMLVYLVLAGLGSAAVHHLALQGGATLDIAFLRYWVTPAAPDLLALAAAGLGVCIGFVCLAEAYRRAPVSVLSVWEYSSLMWAAILGFVAWREIPTIWSLLGSILIVASGVYTATAKRD